MTQQATLASASNVRESDLLKALQTGFHGKTPEYTRLYAGNETNPRVCCLLAAKGDLTPQKLSEAEGTDEEERLRNALVAADAPVPTKKNILSHTGIEPVTFGS